MENPGSEVHDWDWEVVQNDNQEGRKSPPPSTPSSPPSGGGVIRSDYFSLDHAAPTDAAVTAHGAGVEAVGDGCDEEEEVESDNPSWVDPSDSSVVGGRSPNSSSTDSNDRYLSLIQPHSGCGCGGFECKDHLGVSGSDPKTPEVGSLAGSFSGEFHDAIGESKGEEENEGREEQEEVDQPVSQPNSEEEKDEKKRVVWWKVPLEVLRYCVLRVSPVWSLSMAAAALMGFVLLRRRYLYKMKRKSQGIKFNVTVDGKKVSQFMSRAARLNEAFSVVKRVPIIRPGLPAPGMAPWPVMSLR